eukprot:GHRQ01007869.1.p1 GENE.GHRQ01007869.1~~GHRQ01007869.1.p1  ORF type:complete len:177 (+),score=17.27 GHRQ01007869.1:585-1115(+)
MAKKKRRGPATDSTSPLLSILVIIVLIAAVAGYWWSQQQRRVQHPKQQAASRLVPVAYNATVKDMTGQKQSFFFEHLVDIKRLNAAKGDKRVATAIVREVTMPHYNEMLRAKPWRCLNCQKPATKLYLHAMLYLNDEEPHIQDYGPSPCCNSQACGAAINGIVKKTYAEVMQTMRQ